MVLKAALFGLLESITLVFGAPIGLFFERERTLWMINSTAESS
jgi:hypothetical protein